MLLRNSRVMAVSDANNQWIATFAAAMGNRCATKREPLVALFLFCTRGCCRARLGEKAWTAIIMVYDYSLSVHGPHAGKVRSLFGCPEQLARHAIRIWRTRSWQSAHRAKRRGLRRAEFDETALHLPNVRRSVVLLRSPKCDVDFTVLEAALSRLKKLIIDGYGKVGHEPDSFICHNPST